MWGGVRVSRDISIADSVGHQLQVDDAKLEVITVGIPRSPSDFLERALEVGRPRFLPYSTTEAV